MYGVTQSESFHLLNAATLQFGLTETERNRIIRTYARNSYASNIDQVTAAILNEYTVRSTLLSGTHHAGMIFVSHKQYTLSEFFFLFLFFMLAGLEESCPRYRRISRFHLGDIERCSSGCPRHSNGWPAFGYPPTLILLRVCPPDIQRRFPPGLHCYIIYSYTIQLYVHRKSIIQREKSGISSGPKFARHVL